MIKCYFINHTDISIISLNHVMNLFLNNVALTQQFLILELVEGFHVLIKNGNNNFRSVYFVTRHNPNHAKMRKCHKDNRKLFFYGTRTLSGLFLRAFNLSIS